MAVLLLSFLLPMGVLEFLWKFSGNQTNSLAIYLACFTMGQILSAFMVVMWSARLEDPFKTR